MIYTIRFFVLLTLILCAQLTTNANETSDLTQPIKGFLDISTLDQNDTSYFSINGEWELYKDQLLTPSDSNTIFKSPRFHQIANKWVNQAIDDIHLSEYGAHTFRLRVKHHFHKKQELAIRMPKIAASYRLFVDGTMIVKVGELSAQKDSYKPAYQITTPTFFPKSDEIEIVLQIANFDHKKGGAMDEFYMGTAETVLQKRQEAIMKDMFLIGCLMIMGIYHIFLYLFRLKDRAPLYFAITCFVLVLRTLVMGELLMIKLFPSFPWALLLRIEYLTIIVPIFSLSAFIYCVYPKDAPRPFMLITAFVSAVLGIITACATPHFFTSLVGVTQAIIALTAFYTFYVMILVVKRKRTGAIIFMGGVLILLFTIFNDILYHRDLIQSFDMVSIGFFSFIIVQGAMISRRLFKTYKKTEILSSQLNELNRGLEETVEERSMELQEANEELSQQNTFMNTQKRELEMIGLRLQKRNNEVTSSINYAHRIQSSILPSEEKVKRLLGAENYFIIYKPKDILSGDFYMIEECGDKIIIISADCTGHGVPGALMSMLGKQLLSEIIFRKNITDPHVILSELHNGITKTLQQSITQNNDSIDCTVCLFDKSTHELHFAGAKASLFIVVSDTTTQLLKGDRFSAGGKIYLNKPSFHTHSVRIKPNTKIYLYSDGYQDQFGGKDNRKIMAGHFRNLLKKNSHLDMNAQSEFLDSYLEEWKLQGNESQTDDILLMGIKL
ncbi:PP2C family protein-serine/threonine phosphatase [Sediminitomix flava]|uniref:Serine phosphatase RsbU (Regulator of sigma subunit) n=1 Tax=Sediminitomix flava TaxID=379075 RepID=A0A315ZNK0_SEDFL|nr:7TM diverse intracellular signaling domain-containing protein [Sediminitomix flava]PWJ36079.1 serine phosphatase RsbU (regulator of sigma subunit) [Sediminitomix flava]